MLKNPKQKGARNERRSIALLELAGYRCLKSGGSLGEFDVVGIGTKDVVLVQVKSNHAPRALERASLIEFRVPCNVRKFCHIWHDRKRTPDVIEL
jgi:Holliday junction resolvase-like predicted endonuclease